MPGPDALTVSPDGTELSALVATTLDRAAPGRRMVLGISGGPGSGKSTLADLLGAAHDLPVVRMDGFHLADVELRRRGLLDRKGAPETFDAWGFAALLDRVRSRPGHVVMAPGFERDLDQPLAGAVPVPPEADVVLTEGNYLLLDAAPWRAVRSHLDVVWHLDVPDGVRRRWLVDRHVQHGRSRAEAEEWVTSVDEPNAGLVRLSRDRADVVLDLSDWCWRLRS